MLATAIILNYNNYADLKKCLQSLAGQELPAGCRLKIMIIDNNSGDESTLKIKAEFPEHTYIFNSENLGFSKGVNQGLKASFIESDYFLLMNNDASLEKTGLKKLLDISGDIVGPTIFYAFEPAKIWQAGGYYQKIKMNISVPLKNKALPISLRPQAVDFLSGCVLLINKRTLETIGFFDENFFFYGEDLDFCLRAQKAGLKIIYAPEISAWHNIQDIAKSRTSPFVLENLAKSYWLINRKHFPRLLPYSFILFYFAYTPFRLYQIIKGGGSLKNISAWLKGGRAGQKQKI